MEKGVLILTEGRSGSNWLGSLGNSTGRLGNSGEWFASKRLGPRTQKLSAQDHIATVLDRASTGNGFFCIRLFPSHLHWFDQCHGVDLLHHFLTHHDVRFVRLERRDLFRQAISYSKGVQSKQWTSEGDRRREPVYNFAQICRCFFLIERSYAYWESYLKLRDLNSDLFEYENLVADPQPYIDALAAHAGEVELPAPKSDLKVQRDDITEEWLDRFKAEVARNGIVAHSTPARPYRRTFSNFARFFMRRQMKPYPHVY